jgi:hypothetical protein
VHRVQASLGHSSSGTVVRSTVTSATTQVAHTNAWTDLQVYLLSPSSSRVGSFLSLCVARSFGVVVGFELAAQSPHAFARAVAHGVKTKMQGHLTRRLTTAVASHQRGAIRRFSVHNSNTLYVDLSRSSCAGKRCNLFMHVRFAETANNRSRPLRNAIQQPLTG